MPKNAGGNAVQSYTGISYNAAYILIVPRVRRYPGHGAGPEGSRDQEGQLGAAVLWLIQPSTKHQSHLTGPSSFIIQNENENSHY